MLQIIYKWLNIFLFSSERRLAEQQKGNQNENNIKSYFYQIFNKTYTTGVSWFQLFNFKKMVIVVNFFFDGNHILDLRVKIWDVSFNMEYNGTLRSSMFLCFFIGCKCYFVFQKNSHYWNRRVSFSFAKPRY